MPVIGRLDGQVEEVIISPISRRPREDEPPAPPEHGERREPATPPERAPLQTPPAGESSPDAGELPVWLL